MNTFSDTELHGRRIVIKISGKFAEEQQYRDWLIEDAIYFHERGAREAIVYGGQERITQELIAAGIKSEFDEEGIRIIRHKKSAEAVTKAMDTLGHELEASFRRYTDKCHLFLRAIHAARYKYDFVGYPKGIDHLVKSHMDKGDIALVSPIGMSSDGHSHYNENADAAAAEVAIGVGADTYVNVSRSSLRRDGTVVYQIDEGTIQDMIAKGEITGGMLPKVDSCLKAKEHGIETYLIGWQNRYDLRDVILTPHTIV